jgi:sulfur carrier protein
MQLALTKGKVKKGYPSYPFLKFNACTGMEIIINNQPKQIPEQDHFTVQQLLQLEIPGKQQGIAVAINNRVVGKAQWATTRICEQDQIIIIRATQGG